MARRRRTADLQGMAAGPIYSDRRPVPGPSAAVPIGYVEEAHAHHSPSHHVGPCDDYCRRGVAPHYHRRRLTGYRP